VIEGNEFSIQPGSYLLVRNNKQFSHSVLSKEFFAPPPIDSQPIMVHHPLHVVSANKSFSLVSKIAGVDAADKVLVEIHNSSNKWKTLSVQQVTAYDFKVNVPVELITPGVINYRFIILKKNGGFIVFPGNHKSDPYAWDSYENETWQTFVANENAPLEIFGPATDRNTIVVYNPDWEKNSIEYVTADKPQQLILKATMSSSTNNLMGFQFYFSDKIKGRNTELPSMKKAVVKARTTNKTPVKLKLSFISNIAQSFAVYLDLNNEMKEIEVSFSQFQKDSFLLLPRPYPGFLPLWFQSNNPGSFDINNMEKIEISFLQEPGLQGSAGIEIESVYLKKE
jgi:hypothetical protein